MRNGAGLTNRATEGAPAPAHTRGNDGRIGVLPPFHRCRSNAMLDGRHELMTDTEPACDFALRQSIAEECADVFNLGIVELGSGMSFPKDAFEQCRGAAFARHIPHVVGVRAQEQVTGIDALRVVTFMQNELAFRDVTVPRLIGCTVGCKDSIPSSDPAVAFGVDISCPLPALTNMSNALSEDISQFRPLELSERSAIPLDWHRICPSVVVAFRRVNPRWTELGLTRRAGMVLGMGADVGASRRLERMDPGPWGGREESGVGAPLVPASVALCPAQREITSGDAVAGWRWHKRTIITKPP